MDARAVVVREADVPLERWADPVKGEVGFRPLVGTSEATAELTAGVLELAPGRELGVHRHPPAEVYFVLAGTGSLAAGGETQRLEPGTSVWIPGGLEHGVRSTGDSPLRVFYVFAVDSDDDVDYDFAPSGWGS